MHLQSSEFGIFYYNIIPNTEFVNLFIGILVPYLALFCWRWNQAGLTIDELAERSGVPKGTLNKIINGYTRDPQIETVKSIARALDCTLEDFDDSPRVRTLSTDEYDLIQQYRLLDSAGQEVVRFLLTKELERLQNLGVIPTPWATVSQDGEECLAFVGK